MTNSPLISVIIPTFNSLELLKKSIASVKKQTFTDYEIIVVDDGSTDLTNEWIKEVHPDIVYIWQNNAGAAEARNIGLINSKSSLICFLDADDLWDPQKLEMQYEIASKHSHIRLITCDGYKFHSNSADMDTIDKVEKTLLSSIYSKKNEGEFHFNLNFKMHAISTSSVMFYKNDIERVGTLPKLYGGEDFIFFQKLLSLGSGYFIDTPLMYYRAHDKNTSSSNKNVSFKKRMSKVAFKDISRLELLNELETNKLDIPKIVKNYAKCTKVIRYTKLFAWRVQMGSSFSKVLNDIARYLFNYKGKRK